MNVESSDSALWRTLSGESFVRVLIVDDNPADRCLYRRHLEADTEQHYVISEAATAEEADAMLKKSDFDCILLDYRLPGYDGLDMLARLQGAPDTSSVPVIMVTGEGSEHIAVKCLRKGAVDYVPKDRASPVVFKRAIGNAVVQAKMKRKIQEQNRTLKAANHQLRTRNDEIQRFYHTVSHEIKTPLTATREFIAIVLDGLVGEISDEQRNVLTHAKDSCDDIARQFHDLVDCTRAETGKLRLRIEPCSVEALVEKSIFIIGPSLKGLDITLKQSVDGPLPEIPMDGRRMSQVLANLLNNAIKYTPAGGTITVFARHAGESVEFGVRDTGCGIGEDHLPRIFDRLYQANDGADELWGVGLGLGLSIAKEIVGLHGGELLVESDVGVGSTFTVRLPLVGAKQHTAKETVTA